MAILDELQRRKKLAGPKEWSLLARGVVANEFSPSAAAVLRGLVLAGAAFGGLAVAPFADLAIAGFIGRELLMGMALSRVSWRTENVKSILLAALYILGMYSCFDSIVSPVRRVLVRPRILGFAAHS